MWMLYALGSSFFAGITAILAKCGIKKTDSDVATAIRTIVVSISVFMADGTYYGKRKRHCQDQRKDFFVSGAVRPCHRRVLDLLLQSS